MTEYPSLAHGHGLNSIDGYRVVLTRRGGETLDPPLLLASYRGARTFGSAEDFARNYRDNGSWAVVDIHYNCGCWSIERPNIREITP